MKRWTSFPRHTPNWLLRHPLLLAEWLALNNLLRRTLADGSSGGIRGRAAILACAVVSIAAVVTLGSRAAGVLQSLLDYWVMTVAVVAFYSAAMVGRGRRIIEQRHSVSWLTSTPIPAHSARLSRVIKSVFAPIVSSTMVVVGIFVCAALSDVSFLVAAKVTACVTSGAAAGMLLGWLRTTRRKPARAESSRYAPHATRVHSQVASLSALSGWPITQTRAWGRPENARVLVLVALCSVQGGSSALQGLAILSAWLLAGYLGGLLTALVQSARAAAAWLRSTPLHFYQFAWAMSRRALVHQLVGTALAGVVMLMLGATLSVAVYLSIMWLTLVVLASAVGLVEAYRNRSSAGAMTLSLAAMLAVESRQHGWSIPLAALFVAWRLRAGVRK